MIPFFRRLAGLLPAFLSLLLFKGCKPAAAPPAAPGVSIALTYPALLIGQNTFDVRDSEEDLTTTYGYSGLNFVERVILDSDGRLFEVVDAVPSERPKSWLLDLGTSPRHYAVTLREKRKPDLDRIRKLLLEQVNAPNSVWAGDTRAVAKVASLGSVAEAIEACRTSWEWMR